MSLYKNIIILIVVLVLTYFSAEPAGKFYADFLNLPTGFGSFIAPSYTYNFFDGFPLVYIFFLILLFTAFGGNKKYWWIGILLIPAVIFEVYFDLAHIYFPIALGILGWLLGWAVSKLLPS